MLQVFREQAQAVPVIWQVQEQSKQQQSRATGDMA
jgi:hypothetical protein